VREELERSGFQFQRDGLNWTTKDLPMTILVGPKTGHRWEPESKKRSDAFIDEAAKKGRTEPDHIRFVTYTTPLQSLLLGHRGRPRATLRAGGSGCPPLHERRGDSGQDQ